MSAAGFLRDAWQGRLPLWIAYWILGVAGNMGFLALLLAIYLVWGGRGLAALWLLYALSAAWFVFIFASIWRAAAAFRGARIWPFLARGGVCVGVLRMEVEALLLAHLTAA